MVKARMYCIGRQRLPVQTLVLSEERVMQAQHALENKLKRDETM